MLVSFVIPTYNNAAHLGEAVDSALAQTHTDLEIIVVDDGSTDATAVLLERYAGDPRVRVLRHPDGGNHGVSRTRLLGAQASRAAYIALIDADDVCAPGRVAAQLAELERDPAVLLCHSAVEDVYDRAEDAGRFRGAFQPFAARCVYRLTEQPAWLERNDICNSSVMVRREALLKRLRPFDQVFQYEDWMLWILLGLDGPFVFVPDKLVRYRYHPGAATARVLGRPQLHLYASIEALVNLMLQLDEVERARYCPAIGRRFREVMRELAESYRGTVPGTAGRSVLNPFFMPGPIERLRSWIGSIAGSSKRKRESV